MTVGEVFDTLSEIAEMRGEGTVEKKVTALAGLLAKVDATGAKHLVRIPLGASRLGIGEPTILDAFALAKLGDKSKRKSLEEAYNKTSDLGLIGETANAKSYHPCPPAPSSNISGVSDIFCHVSPLF